jgi:hypothetical protein
VCPATIAVYQTGQTLQAGFLYLLLLVLCDCCLANLKRDSAMCYGLAALKLLYLS